MTLSKTFVGSFALLASLAAVIAAAPAPAQAPPGAAGKPPAAAAAESNEQIVADFLGRKQRAEKAQRAILADLRGRLDRRRAEFEEARRKFDDARSCYGEIVGPLPRPAVVTSPDDPRLPYEFELVRTAPNGPGVLSRNGGEPRSR